MTETSISSEEARNLISVFGVKDIDEDGEVIWFVLGDTTESYIHAIVLSTYEDWEWYEHKDDLGELARPKCSKCNDTGMIPDPDRGSGWGPYWDTPCDCGAKR